MRITIPSKKVNAFAFGVPGLQIVGVTRGGLEKWTPEEVEAVLAHEQVHIKQVHNLISSAWAFGFLMAILSNKKKPEDQQLPRLVRLMLLRRIGGATMSYVMERLADRGAKDAGYGPALASALALVEDRPSRHVMEILGGKCHPRTASRVLRLTKDA